MCSKAFSDLIYLRWSSFSVTYQHNQISTLYYLLVKLQSATVTAWKTKYSLL